MIISCEPAFAERKIDDVAYRRRPTRMFIVDRHLRIIAHSSQLNIADLAGRIRQLVRRHIAECDSCAHATVEILDADTALRVVDLAGEDGDYFAITVERLGSKSDAIEDVATEHQLTNREREVFRMLLAGATDGEVSERLLIARTTASDHAKNILRKTGANKRTELFAKVIRYAGRVR
jgi:DNA-binding NarL/FixJ family response regulator